MYYIAIEVMTGGLDEAGQVIWVQDHFAAPESAGLDKVLKVALWLTEERFADSHATGYRLASVQVLPGVEMYTLELLGAVAIRDDDFARYEALLPGSS